MAFNRGSEIIYIYIYSKSDLYLHMFSVLLIL